MKTAERGLSKSGAYNERRLIDGPFPRPMRSSSVFTQLLYSVGLCRYQVMDAVEPYLRHTEQWPFIRKQILAALGDRGIEGLLRKLQREEDS